MAIDLVENKSKEAKLMSLEAASLIHNVADMYSPPVMWDRKGKNCIAWEKRTREGIWVVVQLVRTQQSLQEHIAWVLAAASNQESPVFSSRFVQDIRTTDPDSWRVCFAGDGVHRVVSLDQTLQAIEY